MGIRVVFYAVALEDRTRRGWPYNYLILMVARDRIELPTRGFSVPCSTD